MSVGTAVFNDRPVLTRVHEGLAAARAARGFATLADDVGYAQLGCYGSDIDTPQKLRSVYGSKEMHSRLRAHLATVPHLFNIGRREAERLVSQRKRGKR